MAVGSRCRLRKWRGGGGGGGIGGGDRRGVGGGGGNRGGDRRGGRGGFKVVEVNGEENKRLVGDGDRGRGGRGG